MTKLTDEELIEELKLRLQEHKKNISELEIASEQLKELNEKLIQSESLKSHFISNITNEITNPFASVLALSTEIIKLENSDWDKIKFILSLIHTETFYLDFQLQNIFAAAKIEAGEVIPEISTVDISTLLNNTIELFEIETEKKKLIIEKNIPEQITFKTDSSKLKLILINLISNAIKFSNEDNKIIINIGIAETSLQITVQDFGIGIPENFQKYVFDRFSRYNQTINSIERGQGLGLCIVKAYLDILEGEILLTSKHKEGTTIKICIPESNIETNDFANGNVFSFDEDIFF